MDNRSIDITALILQLFSLDILFKDCNNSDLMCELKLQNENYLKKIIQQNEKIIELLMKGSDENGRKAD